MILIALNDGSRPKFHRPFSYCFERGRGAISAYFDEVYGRDMTHKIESGVAVGKRLAFTQSCAYPDGTRVFCSAMIELKGGKIARQIVVQAWDG